MHFIECQTGLVFWIFGIKTYLTEVLELPRGGTPALNIMVIHAQCHANVSKQRTLFADIDVGSLEGVV